MGMVYNLPVSIFPVEPLPRSKDASPELISSVPSLLCCRDISFHEAVALLGSDAWSLHYSRQHPLVATAAAAISSDQQKQHLQQLPWKNVAPVAAQLAARNLPATEAAAAATEAEHQHQKQSTSSCTAASDGASGASANPLQETSINAACHADSMPRTWTESIHGPGSAAASTNPILPVGGAAGASGGSSEGIGWWEVSDDTCDSCGAVCSDTERFYCRVCEVAQFCSRRCLDADAARGKHPWTACKKLAAVKAGRLGEC